jgi:hypothetical protein
LRCCPANSAKVPNHAQELPKYKISDLIYGMFIISEHICGTFIISEHICGTFIISEHICGTNLQPTKPAAARPSLPETAGRARATTVSDPFSVPFLGKGSSLCMCVYVISLHIYRDIKHIS